MANDIMQFFSYEHLQDEELKATSKTFCNVAQQLDEVVADGPEKTVALRKLLEAKDAAVRAVKAYGYKPDPV